MSDVKKEWYNQASPSEKPDPRWWRLPEEDQFKHVLPLVGAIESRQGYRKTQNKLHERLYSNLDVTGLLGGKQSKADAYSRSRLSLNVVKSCTDTAASKIAGAKPRPLFLTEEGDWKLQTQAKQLTKFIDGAFDASDLYEIAPRIFIDSCVYGTGAIKFYEDEDKGQVMAERAFIDEIVVDDAEGIYGKPMSLFQKRLVNKDVLIDAFPDKAADILAGTAGEYRDQDAVAMHDMVLVTEAWRLPSGSAKNGRHGMFIDSCTLYSVPYEKDHFPFATLRWNHRLASWYGMGLAEELLPIQLEIGKLMRTIQEAQHRVAVPRVYLENNSMVNTQHLNNDIASIVKYTGSPPIFGVAAAMSAEVYQHLRYLVQSAYEITGISQLSAGGKKPAGLDSGAALREFQDIESERFKLAGQRYEQFFLDCAKLMIELTRDLSKKNKKVKVKVGCGKYAETIKFSEVDMEDTKYVMRCFPTSILPTTPAGKLQTVQELAQAGFIDKETAMDLLDFPDTDAAISRKLAPTRIVSKMIDKMIDDGEYRPPEPAMNLALSLGFAQERYLEAKMQGVPEDRLELIRTFMSDCQSLLQEAMAASQPPPMAPMPQGPPLDPGAQPLAAPEAPPTSDLLENVPQGAV